MRLYYAYAQAAEANAKADRIEDGNLGFMGKAALPVIEGLRTAANSAYRPSQSASPAEQRPPENKVDHDDGAELMMVPSGSDE